MSHYTHTLVVRDEAGDIRSTTVARMEDGFVVDMAGHFAYGRGSVIYHDAFEAMRAHECGNGRTVELVADGGALHTERLRHLMLPPAYAAGR